ncbi:MAG TPA: SH3 domain-containing protein [Allosphingosinicella sp.]
MRTKAAALAAIAALAALAAAAPAAAPDRSVRIGLAGADLDACLSVGEVSGLNRRGDNFLAVRAAPSARAPMLARLRKGHRVQVCDKAAGGWLGIVYDRDPSGERDCGTGSPVPRPRAYDGACGAGWVSARYVTIVAG